VRTLQEIQDIFLKIRSGIYLGFVQERGRPAGRDLTRDLLGHPCVRAAVANEHQPVLSARMIIFH
jgi:hypothetical protein